MANKPVAAGHSSLDFVDQELAFGQIVAGRDATYLDLACGAGRYSLALAERLGGRGVIYALDLWKEGLAALAAAADQRGFAAIRPLRADISRPLPLDDGAIDVCFMATALHDFPADAHAPILREIRRVLTPGGAFVLIEFKKSDLGPGPSRARRIGPDEASALASANGFRPDVSLDLGVFTYLSKFLAA